jgi:hypothetical protein
LPEGSPSSVTTRVLAVDVAHLRAADVAAALRQLVGRLPLHPAILPIVDAGVRDGRPFIVTPPVTGEPLDRALEIYGPAAFADALPRLQQIAEALDAAAGSELWHGALQPPDIVVTIDDTRVGAIGVRAALRRVGAMMAAAPPYAAPEVVERDMDSPAADQYALAVIAVQWMYGQPIAHACELGDLPPLSGVDRGYFEHAVATAMASNPADRFFNCREFVRALSFALVDPEDSAVTATPGPEALAGETTPIVGLHSGPVSIEEDRAPVAERSNVVEFEVPGLVGELPLNDPASTSTGSPTHASVPGDRLLLVPPAESVGRRDSYGATAVAATLIGGIAVGAVAMGWWINWNDRKPPREQPSQHFTEAPVSDATATLIEPAPDRAVDAAPAAQSDAALLIHSTPAGSLVTVDGVPRGATPVAVRALALGTRHVVVSRSGYAPAERQVLLTTERPSRTLEIELRPLDRSSTATAARTDGTLVVDSRPAGAAVTIDGRPAGVTPLMLTSVAPGRHTVRLERAGYRAVSTTVAVKPGERARVAARLEEGREQE